MNGSNFLTIILAILVLSMIGFLLYTIYINAQGQGTFYVIFAIIAIVTTGFIIYLMYNNEPGRKSQHKSQGSNSSSGSSSSASSGPSDTNFVKINSTLDSEHQDLFDTLDKVYETSKAHFETEKKLFDEGKAKLCSGHSNVSNMWIDHDNDHNHLLDLINQLKQAWIDHIQQYDKPHFHWTS